MAEMTRGFDFSPPDDQATIARLHGLVDDATLVNVKQADMAAGLSLFTWVEPGAPSAGDNFIELATGSLQLFLSAAFTAGLHGHEPVTLSLTNGTLTQIEPSFVVVWNEDLAGPGRIRISDTPSDVRIAGVAKDQIAPSGTGDIYVKGVVPVLIDIDLVGGTALAGSSVGFVGVGSENFEAANITSAGNGSTTDFGMLMEDLSGSGLVTGWCYIWR